MDFITKLPLVAKKDAILVVCDMLSKITHFVATTEGTLAKGLARLFRDNIWKLYGLLESVVSDRRPQFAVELVTRNYWWLEVMRDIGRYVEGCDLCQRIKNRIEEVVGKLKLSEVPEKP